MKGREKCCGTLGRYLMVWSTEGRDVFLQGSTASGLFAEGQLVLQVPQRCSNVGLAPGA